jgi:hypothetical protein
MKIWPIENIIFGEIPNGNVYGFYVEGVSRGEFGFSFEI